MYGLLAVAFVWLGVGSILARRWARALMLILSWFWLLCGVMGLGFMTVLLPRILAAPHLNGQRLPESARTIVAVVTVAMLAVLFHRVAGRPAPLLPQPAREGDV